MTDYVDGKAAWLAEGLPAVGRVRDDERIASLATPAADGTAIPPDGFAVRPDERIADVRTKVRGLGDDAPSTVYVTTPRARLLGTVDTAPWLRA